MAAAAYAAGFRGDALTTAIAVSLAEDPSGDPTIVCDSCLGVPELSVGYWQINLLAHPQYTVAQMQDGNQNAAAAYAISNGGTNWNPWSTYTNGAYRANIAPAQQLAAAADGSPAISGSTNPTNPPPDRLNPIPLLLVLGALIIAVGG